MELLGPLITVPAFQFLVSIIDFDGNVGVVRIIVDSMAGCLAYFIAFALLRNRFHARGLSVVLSAVLGSLLWVLYKVVKGLILDFDFVWANPSQLYPRHLRPAPLVLSFLVLSFISVSFVALSRLIWHVAVYRRRGL